MLLMPVERIRQPHRKQRHTQVNNPPAVYHAPAWPQLEATNVQTEPEAASEQDEDDMPPLVEKPMSMEDDDDMPPLVEGPPPGLLHPDNQEYYAVQSPADESATSTPDSAMFGESAETHSAKPSHHKKRPAGHISRPPNAFILFRASFIKAQPVPGSIESNNNNLSRIAGMYWNGLPEEERDVWRTKARLAMEQHKRLYPSYRYNPRDQQNRQSSAGRAKRKVKEIPGPPPDPERFQEIARMLVEGKSGEELESAVKERDTTAVALTPEHHTFVGQARFDDPMTEQTFQKRSASDPPHPSKEESDLVASLPIPVPTKVKTKRGSRKRSSSTSTGNMIHYGNKLIAPKQEDSDKGVNALSIGPGRETPFQFYAGRAFTPNEPTLPSPLLSGHMSFPISTTPPTPQTPSKHTTPVLPLGSPLLAISPAASPPYLPTGQPDSPLVVNRSPYMPHPRLESVVNAHRNEYPYAQSLDRSRLSTSLQHISTTRRVQRQQGHPYAASYTSLEHWDEMSAHHTDFLDAAGSQSASGNLFSSIVAPAVNRAHDDSHMRAVPAMLAGHASEYLDQTWPYEVPAFELSSPYNNNNNPGHGPAPSPSESASPIANPSPCSPNSPSPGYMLDLDINAMSPLSYPQSVAQGYLRRRHLPSNRLRHNMVV